MTKDTHESGTEAVECDIVINVQGDEPFIDIELIEEFF